MPSVTLLQKASLFIPYVIWNNLSKVLSSNNSTYFPFIFFILFTRYHPFIINGSIHEICDLTSIPCFLPFGFSFSPSFFSNFCFKCHHLILWICFVVESKTLRYFFRKSFLISTKRFLQNCLPSFSSKSDVIPFFWLCLYPMVLTCFDKKLALLSWRHLLFLINFSFYRLSSFDQVLHK